MIVDRIDRFEKYFKSSEAVEKIARFLKEMTPQMAEKEYEIAGRDIFVRVMSYQTIAGSEAKLEAHRKYADIQATLSGIEAIEWCPAGGLMTKTPYDPVSDVEFYEKPAAALSRIHNAPGIFSLFFPEDAHMPKLMSGEKPARVKKAVVKVNVDVFKALLK